MEFLKRLEELVTRNKKKRWSIIRGMIDDTFKDTYDNWWTAVRPDIQDKMCIRDSGSRERGSF